MFAEPIVITYPVAGEVSLYKQNSGLSESTFSNTDENRRMRISYQKTKNRVRRMLRFDVDTVVQDPLSGLNKLVSHSAYIVVDEPGGSAIDDANLKDLVNGLCSFLTASSGANTDKFLSSQT